MKTTKNALIMSALSLVLCVSMLLGTTYAWFTDSVTSGKNKIISGNLDVGVEYSKDMSNWSTVENATDLFSDVSFWEPGATSIVYLKIENKGTLDLKYKLGINIESEKIGINVDNEEFKLSDFIYHGIKGENVTSPFENRAAAIAAVEEEAELLSSGYTYDGVLDKTVSEKLLALVVYMPEEDVSGANYMTDTEPPVIELGIQIVATQQSGESDSFGSDYDEGAEIEFPVILPETEVAKKIEKNDNGTLKNEVILQNEKSHVAENTSVSTIIAKVPAGAKLDPGTEELKLKVAPKTTAPEGAYVEAVDPLLLTTLYYDIDIIGLADDNTSNVELSIYVGDTYNTANIRVYHKEEQITFTYTEGYVKFVSATFSPFTIILGDGNYHIDKVSELKAVVRDINGGTKYDGKTIVLDKDINLKKTEWTQIDGAGHNITFDGNGKTIKNLKISEGHNAGFFATGSGCTVKNLTIDGATVTGVGRVGVICGHGMCVTVENCTVKNATVTAVVTNNDDGDKAGAIVGYLSGEPNASVRNCKVENCTVTGYRDIGGLVGYAGGTYTVTGNSAKNVTVVCDRQNNYNNYTEDTQYDVRKLVGEQGANGTVDGNTETDVVVSKITYVAEINEAPSAIGNAQTGDVVILPASEVSVQLPALVPHVTVKGDGTTKINAVGEGSITAITNGATFEGLVFDFGNANYHGFQHAGDIVFKNCTLNGLLISYGNMVFEDCVFNAQGGEYSMWAYGTDLTYDNCTFNGQGKWINVYCESNDEVYNVEFNECKFVNTGVANKAAVNVKDSCGETRLKYNVELNDCTYEGSFPEATKTETTIIYSPLVMVDDIVENGENTQLTVRVNGEKLFPLK